MSGIMSEEGAVQGNSDRARSALDVLFARLTCQA